MAQATATPAKGYAAHSATTPLALWNFERRAPRPDDVSIEILYCGVCHSDLHFARDDWGMASYPVVPGHEIVGRVTAVGDEVSQYQVGDLVGVGCMVDSCRECKACNAGLENYCAEGFVMTYGSPDKHDGTLTQGGYSDKVVVSERFVVRMPDGIDLKSAAPILCAGITTYSPLKHYGVKPGDKVGVIGMGGLGHMGVKLAKALGAEVTLFTRSESKKAEAKKQGADHVVISTSEDEMGAITETFDFMLDTVPVQHDINPYLNALKPDYSDFHLPHQRGNLGLLPTLPIESYSVVARLVVSLARPPLDRPAGKVSADYDPRLAKVYLDNMALIAAVSDVLP